MAATSLEAKLKKKERDRIYYHEVIKKCPMRSRQKATQRSWNKRLKRYGITSTQYLEMLFLQLGVCKICKKPEPSAGGLRIDHDHETGKVRGLLCNDCNVGLGRFHDSTEALLSAVRYLENPS